MGYHKFIDAMLRGATVTVNGDGLQVRGNTYISDAIEATIASLDAPIGEIYNVGGGETANVWEILAKLESILGCRAIIRREPARPGDQRITGADTTKLSRHLNWRPHVGLDEGLSRQVVWQRSLVQRLAA